MFTIPHRLSATTPCLTPPLGARLSAIAIRNCNLLTIALAAAFIGLTNSAYAQELQFGINPVNFGVAVWNQTNAYRATFGSPRIGPFFGAPPRRAAQKYAEFLARTNQTGHTADGRDAGQRLLAEGFSPCYWAENVYEQWNSPQLAPWQNAADGAMNFWRNSPGHATNMRDPRAKYLGVGVAAWRHGDRNYYKVVQVFADDCRPPRRPRGPLGKRN
jgi:uncharacterized protein YkwD